MPVCSKCETMQATVEMRKSPKKGPDGAPLWLCKNQQQCKQRRGAKRANQIATRKGS